MPQEIGFGKLCCTVPVETNRINICVHILGQREHPFRANVIRATKPHNLPGKFLSYMGTSKNSVFVIDRTTDETASHLTNPAKDAG
jgi:hypothetical protein